MCSDNDCAARCGPGSLLTLQSSLTSRAHCLPNPAVPSLGHLSLYRRLLKDPFAPVTACLPSFISSMSAYIAYYYGRTALIPREPTSITTWIALTLFVVFSAIIAVSGPRITRPSLPTTIIVPYCGYAAQIAVILYSIGVWDVFTIRHALLLILAASVQDFFCPHRALFKPFPMPSMVICASTTRVCTRSALISRDPTSFETWIASTLFVAFVAILAVSGPRISRPTLHTTNTVLYCVYAAQMAFILYSLRVCGIFTIGHSSLLICADSKQDFSDRSTLLSNVSRCLR